MPDGLAKDNRAESLRFVGLFLPDCVQNKQGLKAHEVSVYILSLLPNKRAISHFKCSASELQQIMKYGLFNLRCTLRPHSLCVLMAAERPPTNFRECIFCCTKTNSECNLQGNKNNSRTAAKPVQTLTFLFVPHY